MGSTYGTGGCNGFRPRRRSAVFGKCGLPGEQGGGGLRRRGQRRAGGAGVNKTVSGHPRVLKLGRGRDRAAGLSPVELVVRVCEPGYCVHYLSHCDTCEFEVLADPWCNKKTGTLAASASLSPRPGPTVKVRAKTFCASCARRTGSPRRRAPGLRGRKAARSAHRTLPRSRSSTRS